MAYADFIVSVKSTLTKKEELIYGTITNIF